MSKSSIFYFISLKNIAYYSFCTFVSIIYLLPKQLMLHKTNQHTKNTNGIRVSQYLTPVMELTDLNQTCPGVEVNVLYQKMRNKTPPGGWTWPVCTASTTLLFTIGQKINLGVRNFFTLINNHILLNVYNFSVYEFTKSKRILYSNLISSCSRVMTLSDFLLFL